MFIKIKSLFEGVPETLDLDLKEFHHFTSLRKLGSRFNIKLYLYIFRPKLVLLQKPSEPKTTTPRPMVPENESMFNVVRQERGERHQRSAQMDVQPNGQFSVENVSDLTESQPGPSNEIVQIFIV